MTGKKVLTAEEILAKCKVSEVEYEIEGIGTIKVKGLTKDMQQKARKEALVEGLIDSDMLEIAIFKAGVVEPQLNDETIKLIIDSMPAATFDEIVLKISDLSGIDKTSAVQIKKALP